jgi:hypothetical protein
LVRIGEPAQMQREEKTLLELERHVGELAWVSWKPAIGRPNCSRCVA